jgi:HD-GYP domain-containing protein (c-di-GMP phosphodiesterase class II)
MKNHPRRVAALTTVLCRCLALDQRTATEFELAAYCHDVGKLAVPQAILGKPERLTPEEVRLVRRHTVLGAMALRGFGGGLPSDVALRHHEAWDGSGYPDGLKCEAIPFAARLISVCDVYSALREDRPYRRGMSHEAALGIMLKGDGVATRPEMFDPDLLSTFAKHHLLFAAAADALAADPGTLQRDQNVFCQGSI